MTTDTREALAALTDLESVLCDPEGRASIRGSEGDLKIIDAALAVLRAALATQPAQPMELEQRLTEIAKTLPPMTIIGWNYGGMCEPDEAIKGYTKRQVLEILAAHLPATQPAAQPSAQGEAVALTEHQKTAPSRIWLNIFFDEDRPFPSDHEGITWSEDAVGDFDVPYVRADIACAPAAPAQPSAQGEAVLDRESTWWSLAMGAAASLEDAANCMRDEDAERAALGAAAHVRKQCATLAAAPAAQPSAQGEAVARKPMLDYDALCTAFCAKWSGNTKVEAGDVLDWIMQQPLASAPAAPAQAVTDAQINGAIRAQQFWRIAAQEFGFSFGPELHDFARAVLASAPAAPAQAVPLTPGWVCQKCGTDRTKVACPKGHHAAVTGECPMVGTTGGIAPKAAQDKTNE